MKVKDIMSSKVEWAEADASITEIARKMRDLDIGCLPVRERADGKLIGMITDRDITCRAVATGRDLSTMKVSDVMSKGAVTCFDDQNVTDAAHLMEEKQLHRLAILDHKNKQMLGMLSLADVALHASRELSGEVIEAISRPTKREQQVNMLHQIHS